MEAFGNQIKFLSIIYHPILNTKIRITFQFGKGVPKLKISILCHFKLKFLNRNFLKLKTEFHPPFQIHFILQIQNLPSSLQVKGKVFSNTQFFRVYYIYFNNASFYMLISMKCIFNNLV